MNIELIKKEAKRITKELIKINKSDKSLDEIFHSLLNKKYYNYDMKILYYIPNILAENNYFIKSFNPFILEKK